MVARPIAVYRHGMPDRRPTPVQVAGKLTQRARTRGPGEMIGLGLERLRKAWSSEERLLFLVHPAGGDDPIDPPDLVFRAATPEDGSIYARDIGTDSAATFRARLSDATRCWLVLHEGKIAHATWTTTATAWTREVGRYFKPPPGDGYIYESFTSPAVRGRGIYPLALKHILARLGAEGIARMWVGVEADNEPSIRAITKAGFEVAFEISYRRRFGRLTLGIPEGPLAEAGTTCFPRTAP
ncbi:MAG: GNAT family N-acetyltransferase [Actinobacteria bacterium]|nr:GNAT family N-acetyltransferase [Actinomycetota bacterium]